MRARRLRVWVVGSLGLALPLALTALGYRATRASLERSRAAHFEEAARGTTRAHEERLAAYEAALVSARALLVARPDVDRRACAAFVAQLDVPHRLLGLQQQFRLWRASAF